MIGDSLFIVNSLFTLNQGCTGVWLQNPAKMLLPDLEKHTKVMPIQYYYKNYG